MEDNIGCNNTCPRLFNADMVQWEPVPITDSGGSTNPNDHRAYLFVYYTWEESFRDVAVKTSTII